MPSTPPDSTQARVGQVLDGRYRILQKIAEGAMGVVYLAERLKLKRRVAVKFLRANFAVDDRFRARFEREARAMSRLDHPHVVSVIDFGVADAPYIVMERIIGRDLQEVLELGRTAPARAVHIARQMLAGLAHAHGVGIVHRDIKPGNVMLTDATGTGDYVRLLDFGLATLRDPDNREVSQADIVVGTPSYMSPEQSMGEKVDARTDIYSTAVVLYELLTGVKPFTTEDTYETLRRHREEPAPPMSEVAPDLVLPDGLEQVVLRALHKNRDRRYQTAIEFADALKAVMDDDLARAPTMLADEQIAQTVAVERSRGMGVGALLVLVTAAVAAGGWLLARELDLGGGNGDEPASPVTTGAPASAAPAAAMPDPAGAPIDAGAIDAPTLAAVDAGAIDAADEEIDGGLPEVEMEPVEVDPAPEPEPQPLTMEVAKQLIADGKREEAITHLRRMRRKSPRLAHVPYLLGNLYFEKGWWTAGLKAYHDCLSNNRGYRVNPTLIRNAISTLASSKSRTRKLAYDLLIKKIGRAGVSKLKRAAAKDRNPKVRSRAKYVLKKMGRR